MTVSRNSSFIAIAVFISLIYLSKLEAKTYKIRLHEKDPVCVVDTRFLSFAIGAYHARQRFKALDFTSQKLKNVVSALRPAYLRFGGSDSNFLIFRPGSRLVQPTLITTGTTSTTPTTTLLTSTTQRMTIAEKTTTTTQRTTSIKTTTTIASPTTTTEPPTTTTEPPTTSKKTTTTETPTTMAPRPTTMAPRPTTIAPRPTTMAPIPTTPIFTAPPQHVTPPQQPITPPAAVPVTTPPQSQLPNVNPLPNNGLPSWGNVQLGNSNEDKSKSDSEKDENRKENKEYQKDGKYFVADIKEIRHDQGINSQYQNNERSVQNEASTTQQLGTSFASATDMQASNSVQQTTATAVQQTQPVNSTADGRDTTVTAPEPQQMSEKQDGRLAEIDGVQSEIDSQDAIHREENGNTGKRAVFATLYQEHDSKRRQRTKRYIMKLNKNKVENESRKDRNAKKRSRNERFPFWLAAEDFDRLARFIQDTGLKLIFTLNGFFRRPDGSWDATNAIDLVRHVKGENYDVAWEIGNEPNRYTNFGQERALSAEQIAQDTIRVRSLLTRNKEYGSLLIGPALSRPGIADAEKFLTNFLDAAAWAIDAVTWHQYYIGKHASSDDFTNPRTLNIFKAQIQEINKTVRKTKTNKPVWVGETGSAWGGGVPGLSDTFAASFMFLDKLGLAGLYCNQVVIRQSLIGGSYALLDDDFTPRPDYWVSLIHKKLVGRKVFAVSGGDDRVRVYTHCTRSRAGYPEGALTVIAINLWKKTKAKLKFEGRFGQQKIDEYMVTSSNGKVNSKNVDLNGDELHLNQGIYVPRLHPTQAKMPLTLPPLSYAFYVIPFANSVQCM